MDKLAFDRSVRRFDQDGRLHVALTNISKANICPYYGREIPNAEALGLKPDEIYQLFRAPDELKKAAGTSNNIQLMRRHVRVTADQPQKDAIVGSTGTDGEFTAPYLKNSLVVWDKEAIDLIESEQKKELSCSYHYTPDMTPGTYEGVHFDGVMRDIKFNHVALVEDGRAGDDVAVDDELPAGLRDHFSTGQGTDMTVSRKALLARGALSSHFRPLLAKDKALPDLKAVLLGTTATNWPTAKPTIAKRLKAAMAGRLANDSSIEDIHKLLDSLDKDGEGEPDTMDGEMDGEDEEAETEEEKAERMKRRLEAKDKAARDAEGETEEEMRKRHAEEVKGAKDRDGEGETEEERKKREATEAKDKAAADKRARDSEPKPVTKEAMDAALATQAKAIRQEMKISAQRLREAEEIVKPVIGNLLAQDSAEDVYRVLFDQAGVDVKDFPVAGYKQLAVQTVKAMHVLPAPRLASDAATVTDFAKKFPNASRVRVIG